MDPSISQGTSHLRSFHAGWSRICRGSIHSALVAPFTVDIPMMNRPPFQPKAARTPSLSSASRTGDHRAPIYPSNPLHHLGVYQMSARGRGIPVVTTVAPAS